MNPADRLQALIRHPDYRNDPRLKSRLKFDLDQFDLPGLFSKTGPLGHWDEEWWRGKCELDEFLRIWGLTRAVDPEDKIKVEAELKALRAGDASIFTDDLRGYDASENYYKPDADYGQFFSINVDLERPTGELLQLIRVMIDNKRRERGIRTKRSKPHAVDPWEVWDKAQIPGNTLLKIARLLFKVKGNPAYVEETKQAYDQVQRAYHKAVSMIEDVGKCRNKEFPKDGMEEPAALFRSMMQEVISSVAEGRSPDFDAAGKRTIGHKA